MIEKVRLLGENVQIAKKAYRANVRLVEESKDTIRALNRDLNTLTPEIMILKWEIDQFTRYVMKSAICLAIAQEPLYLRSNLLDIKFQ